MNKYQWRASSNGRHLFSGDDDWFPDVSLHVSGKFTSHEQLIGFVNWAIKTLNCTSTVDWQTMYEQMTHRCQALDQKLSEYEAMDMQKSYFVTEANSREQFAETLRLWADSTILMGVESLVTGVSPKELKDTLREVASRLTCNYDASPKDFKGTRKVDRDAKFGKAVAKLIDSATDQEWSDSYFCEQVCIAREQAGA